MLFNSPIFLFCFLPLCLAAFYCVASRSNGLAVALLGAASLVFYSWFDQALLPLLAGSVLFNYAGGRLIARSRADASSRARMILIGMVTADLLLLGFFKYANFFLDTAAAVSGTPWAPLNIVLPIGISFFTFTQIAFLVDTYSGKAEEYDFLRYLLFVTYFPHLIAGPIFHHSEMMPQFARFGRGFRFDATANAVGVTCFAIGLIKKVGIADYIAPLANVFFDASKEGAQLSMAEAWSGALAYTFQIYFDFSGYCDMAIGLSLLFGVRLPINFNSPYKAVSIIEFWRCWHMTLSRYLRDYLYIPLGGNRRGGTRRYLNLLITMMLGGLWHGAGWTFVIWGLLHGAYLIVNHAWRNFGFRLHRWVAWAITFGCVVVAWVFFRADSAATAANMVAAMFGNDGYSLLAKLAFPNELVTGRLSTGCALLAALALVLIAPNTIQLMASFQPVIENVSAAQAAVRWQWRPTLAWGFVAGGLLATGIALMSENSPFLYFQF